MIDSKRVEELRRNVELDQMEPAEGWLNDQDYTDLLSLLDEKAEQIRVGESDEGYWRKITEKAEKENSTPSPGLSAEDNEAFAALWKLIECALKRNGNYFNEVTTDAAFKAHWHLRHRLAEGTPKPAPPTVVVDVRAYLVNAIISWRKKRETGCAEAIYYIDAFQSVHTSLFGDIVADPPAPPAPGEKELEEILEHFNETNVCMADCMKHNCPTCQEIRALILSAKPVSVTRGEVAAMLSKAGGDIGIETSRVDEGVRWLREVGVEVKT